MNPPAAPSTVAMSQLSEVERLAKHPGHKDLEEEKEWEDWEDDDACEFECLFCEAMFMTLEAMHAHCDAAHKFSCRELLAQQQDMYMKIRLINFIRTNVKQGTQSVDDFIQHLQNGFSSAEFATEDKYLTPVIPEDPVLHCLDEDDSDFDTDEDEDEFGRQRDAAIEAELCEKLEATCGKSRVKNADVDAGVAEMEEAEDGVDIDSYYFDSYSGVDIHHEMIADKVRTDGYMNGIKQNAHLFKGKVVLDVGCGTSILSMFAAQAGAKKVIGIDCSGMIECARKIVKANGFEDVITLIHGKVEEVELPVDHVDIIISEWMGYCLLYESMLDTVLFAREKWLVKDGHVLPDLAEMFLQGVIDVDNRVNFWDNVYGFDMSAVKPKVNVKEPIVRVVDPKLSLTDRPSLIKFCMETVSYEELNYSCPFVLKVNRAGELRGFVSSFDIEFARGCTNPVMFSTGMESTPTHWQQVYFPLKEALHVVPDTEIHGTWSLRRNAKNQRFIDVDITWTYNNATSSQHYTIE